MSFWEFNAVVAGFNLAHSGPPPPPPPTAEDFAAALERFADGE